MFTIVKNETFNSWPADVRKVIEDMKMEHTEWAGNYAHSEGQGGLTYAIEKGVKKTTIPPDERAKMLALLKPLTDDWVKVNSAKGLPAKQGLDEFYKLLDKYNKQY
jgi:TRAP-type C4-dicarboxylate transport system substrate-binding protein